mgnify:FL=1
MKKGKIGLVVLAVFLVLSLIGLGYSYFLYTNKVEDYRSLETKYKESETNYKALKSNYDKLSNKNNSIDVNKRNENLDYSGLKYKNKDVSDSVVDTVFETWEGSDGNDQFFYIKLLLSGKVLISINDQSDNTKNYVKNKQLEGITDAVKLLYNNDAVVYILTKSGNVYRYSLYDANLKKYTSEKIYGKSNIEKIMLIDGAKLAGITYNKNVVVIK